MATMTHIDDWLDDAKNREAHRIAHDFFTAHRRSAAEQVYSPYEGKLFCTWSNKRWRVLGCSRMGDVWLTSHFERDHGYEHRVDVAECSDWCADAL